MWLGKNNECHEGRAKTGWTAVLCPEPHGIRTFLEFVRSWPSTGGRLSRSSTSWNADTLAVYQGSNLLLPSFGPPTTMTAARRASCWVVSSAEATRAPQVVIRTRRPLVRQHYIHPSRASDAWRIEKAAQELHNLGVGPSEHQNKSKSQWL